MSEAAFSRADRYIVCVLPEYGPDRRAFRDVVQFGTRPVRVDIIYLVYIQSCIGQRQLHRHCGSGAVRQGGGNMITVVGRAVAEHFGVDFCTAFFRMAGFFQNQYPGSFGKDKTVPAFVERS